MNLTKRWEAYIVEYLHDIVEQARLICGHKNLSSE